MPLFTGAAVGAQLGASLLGGILSNQQSKRANRNANAAQQAELRLGEKELTRRRGIDSRNLARINRTNKSLLNRMDTSDQLFREIMEDIRDPNSETRGVDEAVSIFEGNANRSRRSLRNFLGGGLQRSRGGALNLSANRQRTQLISQIIANNQARLDSKKSGLAAPVSLVQEGVGTTGAGIENLQGIHGNMAKNFLHDRDTFATATGAFGAAGTKSLLRLLEKNQSPDTSLPILSGFSA